MYRYLLTINLILILFHLFISCPCLKINTDDRNYECVQDKPIIERPIPSPKRTASKNTGTIKRTTEDEIQIDVTNDTNSNANLEETKNYEDIIAKHESTIKSMVGQLKVKEIEIENLMKKCENKDVTEQYEQILNEKAKWEKIDEQKENTIESMRKKLEEKETAIENLKKKHENDRIAIKQKLVEQTDKNEKIMDEMEKLKLKYEKSVEEENKLSRKLQQITTNFLGPTDTTVDLSDEEKKTLKTCVEFINLNSTLRASVASRNKSIQKKINSIKSHEAASKRAYEECE